MFKPYNQNQLQLLPPDLGSMLKQDHLARLISRAVDDMDISFIEQTYSPHGQHAYQPRMLLKILVYDYAAGIRGSRKLADRLNEDIAFMWLAGRQTPDFRTISDFRKDKLTDFKRIFDQVLNICFDTGLIRVGKVSLDGTKILANASRNKAVYRTNLKKRRELIRQKVEEIMQEVEAADEEEERLYGNATPHRTGIDFTDPKVLEKISKSVKKIQKERQKLEKKKNILKAQEAEITRKERTMRKDRNSYSSVDKDATVMMVKEGYPAPAYNAQLATERQVILSYGLSSRRNDQKLLKPMVEELKERTKRRPETLIADAGYGTKLNYRYLQKEKIPAYIPYNTYEQERILRNKGLYQLPKEPDTEYERYKFRQRLRLPSEEGKLLMKRRREDGEPVIGNLKRNMGFRRFNLRGKRKCELELGLVSLAHNFLKIRNWVKKAVEWDDGRAKGARVGSSSGVSTSLKQDTQELFRTTSVVLKNYFEFSDDLRGLPLSPLPDSMRKMFLPNSQSFLLERPVLPSSPVLDTQEFATRVPPPLDSGDSDAPKVGDKNKRIFLKTAGIAGAGIAASLLLPKKAEALIMGSSPTTGVVGVKDASNVRINPAKEETLATVLKKTDLTFDAGSVAVKVTSLPDSSFSDSGGTAKKGLVDATTRNVQVDVITSALPASASTETTLQTISFGGTQFALRLATDSVNTNIDYVGEASVGTVNTAASWRIKKIDSTTGTVITWADGNGSFDNIWNNRESLSYS